MVNSTPQTLPTRPDLVTNTSSSPTLAPKLNIPPQTLPRPPHVIAQDRLATTHQPDIFQKENSVTAHSQQFPASQNPTLAPQANRVLEQLPNNEAAQKANNQNSAAESTAAAASLADQNTAVSSDNRNVTSGGINKALNNANGDTSGNMPNQQDTPETTSQNPKAGHITIPEAENPPATNQTPTEAAIKPKESTTTPKTKNKTDVQGSVNQNSSSPQQKPEKKNPIILVAMVVGLAAVGFAGRKQIAKFFRSNPEKDAPPATEQAKNLLDHIQDWVQNGRITPELKNAYYSLTDKIPTMRHSDLDQIASQVKLPNTDKRIFSHALHLQQELQRAKSGRIADDYPRLYHIEQAEQLIENYKRGAIDRAIERASMAAPKTSRDTSPSRENFLAGLGGDSLLAVEAEFNLLKAWTHSINANVNVDHRLARVLAEKIKATHPNQPAAQKLLRQVNSWNNNCFFGQDHALRQIEKTIMQLSRLNP